MKTSVIVTTYNKPGYLKLSLLSLAAQSMLPSEVIIADDGSTDETRMLVSKMREALKHKFLIKHAWWEDIGFRRSGILNKAVHEASGEYLIFTDADCMAHRHFVRAHVENSEPSAILGGKRVELGQRLTERLLAEGKIINSLTAELALDGIFGNSRKVEEALRLENHFLRRLFHRDRMTEDGIWGCNCSLYKDLFKEVNGYDENFLYAVEDNDLGIRVINTGKKVKSVRGLAIVFHLWHQVRWNFGNEKYQHDCDILKKRIAKKESVCKNGYVKL